MHELLVYITFYTKLHAAPGQTHNWQGLWSCQPSYACMTVRQHHIHVQHLQWLGAWVNYGDRVATFETICSHSQLNFTLLPIILGFCILSRSRCSQKICLLGLLDVLYLNIAIVAVTWLSLRKNALWAYEKYKGTKIWWKALQYPIIFTSKTILSLLNVY